MRRPMESAITRTESDRITVRGFDLAHELIGKTTATEYFYVLLTGQRPTLLQVAIMDACIVAVAEHGFVPSVQVARMTYASAPESLQGAVSAGLLGCGSVILGSSESTGDLLVDVVADTKNGKSLADAAHDRVQALKDAGAAVPGVGHPLHRVEDPRATALLNLAATLGTEGLHTRALRAVVGAVPEVYGRTFPLNVSGVIPAVLLDVDFPAAAMKGIPLIGRTMSLVAHLLEEQQNPIGFQLADAAADAVTYVAG